MRLVIQRAKNAKVEVEGKITGQIESGLMILVGVTHEDTEKEAFKLADKLVNLRIFEDENNKMNLSLLDVKGAILSVSQFTLYADCKKGNRPSFTKAGKPDMANELYEKFNEYLRQKGIQVETGIFGAMMDVSFTNDGPVTIILDSDQL